MTSPSYINPPRVVLPDDSDNGFVDAEMALVTIIDEIIAPITPEANAFTLDSVPDDITDRIDRGETLISVKRVGGEADGVFDHPRMDVNVAHAYRTDAWRVMGFIRRKLLKYSGVVTNPDGTTAIVNAISDATGPQRSFETDNSRVVTLSFSMQTRIT